MGMAVQPRFGVWKPIRIPQCSGDDPFRGITSFLLGLPPQSGRNLKLDVLYPIGGYSRCCIQVKGKKELFIYHIPSKLGGRSDAAKKREMERSLDPPDQGNLIKSSLREDSVRNVKYYELEFRVESPSFRRHNVSVCCARGEAEWPGLKSDFYRIANSFSLTT
ncbi:PsbP domain-containing protein 7, chloroplastic [Glycine max]|nr:PsbP domain-containing protein 7, chloroplastic [Glycine max]